MGDSLITEGKTVFVTGAAMGFGPEICMTLAEQGFHVVGGVWGDAESKQMLQACADRGVKMRLVDTDPRDGESIERAVSSVAHHHGGVRALVSNAALLLRGFFEDLSDGEIRDHFEINFFGMLAAVRAVLPQLREAAGGRIVIISSVAGRLATCSGGAYSATRFAQEGFAESLLQEVQPLGIDISLIEPGIVKTPTWTLHRSAGARTHNPDSPYLKWFLKLESDFGEALDHSKLRPSDVAERVLEALTARRPRLRYVVGNKAKTLLRLQRYLPERLFQGIFNWILTQGRPRHTQPALQPKPPPDPAAGEEE